MNIFTYEVEVDNAYKQGKVVSKQPFWLGVLVDRTTVLINPQLFWEHVEENLKNEFIERRGRKQPTRWLKGASVVG